MKDQLIGVAREINVKYVECVQQRECSSLSIASALLLSFRFNTFPLAVHCLSKDFAKAGTPPCPTGDKYSTAGCAQLVHISFVNCVNHHNLEVDVHPYISAEPYDKISCPEGKKLL